MIGNNTNEADLFVGGGHFYDFIVEVFAGGDAPKPDYQTLGTEMAASAR